MAKKYQPSGYQIIVIDVSDKINQTPFTPETDDEKLLHNLLQKSSSKDIKPILLSIKGTSNGNVMGFTSINDSNTCFLYTEKIGSLACYSFYLDSDKLVYEYTEE